MSGFNASFSQCFTGKIRVKFNKKPSTDNEVELKDALRGAGFKWDTYILAELEQRNDFYSESLDS